MLIFVQDLIQTKRRPAYQGKKLCKMKTLTTNQPKNLKRVLTQNRLALYFTVSTSKKQIENLLNNTEFEHYGQKLMKHMPIKYELNSVWYDRHGNCHLIKE